MFFYASERNDQLNLQLIRCHDGDGEGNNHQTKALLKGSKLVSASTAMKNKTFFAWNEFKLQRAFCDEFFMMQLKPLSCHFNWRKTFIDVSSKISGFVAFSSLFNMKFNDNVMHRLKLFKLIKKEKVVLIMVTTSCWGIHQPADAPSFCYLPYIILVQRGLHSMK